MKQFRKVLPNYLQAMNLLNEAGEIISDGAEAFRVLFYQHWVINRKAINNFSMPDNPFSEENDENNPLTWKNTPYRAKALAVYRSILYYQIEAEDAQRDKNKARSKYTAEQTEALKKKLHMLYMKSQEVTPEIQPETVEPELVKPVTIQDEAQEPVTIAPDIDTQPKSKPIKLTPDNWKALTKNCQNASELRAVLSSASWRTLAKIAETFDDFIPPSKATDKDWYLDGITDIVFFEQDEDIRHLLSLKPNRSLYGLEPSEQREILDYYDSLDEIMALLWTLPDWKAIDSVYDWCVAVRKTLWEPNKARMKYNYAGYVASKILSNRKEKEELKLRVKAHETQRETKVPELERCPHCGSKHKPYFSYHLVDNWSLSRANFAYGDGAKEWMTATLKCRDCGHRVMRCFSYYPESEEDEEGYPTRERALDIVASKWCLDSACADRTTWKFKPEPLPYVYEADILPQATETPALAEQNPEPVASAPKLEDSGIYQYDHHEGRIGWSYLSIQARKRINPMCRRNREIIAQCNTAEEMIALLCTISPMGIYNQAWYDGFKISRQTPTPINATDEEKRAVQQRDLAELYTELMMKRRERKAKAEARKNAPKSAPKPKTRKPRRQETPNQILICFGEPEPAEVSSQGATLKPEINTQETRTSNQSLPKNRTPKYRRRAPKNIDESRQILLVFGEEIIGGDVDQRKAA